MITPRTRGFAMVPGWHATARYWLAWPSAQGRWGDRLEMARDGMAGLAGLLSEHRPVSILANPEELAEVSLHCGPGVGAQVVPHETCRLRLLGPSFVSGADGLAAVVWPTPGGDAGVAAAIVEQIGLPLWRGPLPLVTGMVDGDGEGTCLASEALLAAVGDRAAVETALHDWLGAERVIWMATHDSPSSLQVHLLRYARFLAPGLVAATDHPDDKVLAENLARLGASRDAKGRTLEVVPLPSARPHADDDRRAWPMSYVNCLVDGGLVVMPAFEDGRDDTAYDRIVAALPDHTVVSYPARDFAQSGGLGALILAEPAAAAGA